MMQISYKMTEYRKQLFNTINNGDVIIELGCHVGKTTEKILKKFSDCKVIGIDNSPEAIPKMEKLEGEYENLTFISGDVRLHEKILETYKIIDSCDVLSIDLGGGYHPDTVFKVFYIWSSTFKPKHTLIRNRGILEFCNSAVTSNNSFETSSGYLVSYNNEGIPPQIKEFDLWTDSLSEK